MTMNVYVLTLSHNDENTSIRGVFSTRELADKYAWDNELHLGYGQVEIEIFYLDALDET